MATIRHFTREDWYGYAGAETLTDGEPVIVDDQEIGPWRVAGEACDNLVIVVDRNGATLMFGNDKGDAATATRRRPCRTVAEARAFAAEILAAIEDGNIPAGFKTAAVAS